MKIIEVDDELYQFIAAKTEKIGEEASDILRRLLGFAPLDQQLDQPDQVPNSTVIKSTVIKSAVVETATGDQAETVMAVASDTNTASVKPAAAKKAKTAAKVASQVTSDDSQTLPQPSERLNALSLTEIKMQKGVVGRFLYILSTLQKFHPTEFDKIVNIRGRDRLYFGKAQDDLLSSGSSTNPKEIGDSGYWVLTNSNTSRKKWMLSAAAQMLGYSPDDIVLLSDMLEQADETKAKKIKKEQTKKAKAEKAREKAAKAKSSAK